MNGSIPSAVCDSCATAHAGMLDSPFIPTGKKSDKIFQVPTGDIIEATEIMELYLDVLEPTKRVDIVPGVTTNNMLTVIKVSGSTKMKLFESFLFIPFPTQDTGSNLVQ